MHDAEDGAVGAEAEREREHREGGEHGRTRKRPQRVADIGLDGFPGHRASLLLALRELFVNVGKEQPLARRGGALERGVAGDVEQRRGEERSALPPLDRGGVALAKHLSHRRAVATAEAAREREQQRRVKALEAHARPPGRSRRCRAASTCSSSRRASPRATASPFAVSR